MIVLTKCDKIWQSVNMRQKKELKQARIYIPDEHAKVFEKLAGELGQSESWLASCLFESALKAVAESQEPFTLPLVLSPAVKRPKSKAA